MFSASEIFHSYEREVEKYPFLHIAQRTPDFLFVDVDCDGRSGFAKIYCPFPGVCLSFFSFDASSFANERAVSFPGLRLNYCFEGCCEIVSGDDNHLFIEPNDMVFTSCTSENGFFFSNGNCHVVELYFQTPRPADVRDGQDAPDAQGAFLLGANIDIGETFQRLIGKGESHVRKAAKKMKYLLESLRCPPKNYELAWYRLKVGEILILLAGLPQETESRRCTFYTKGQVEIAKQVMRTISADLSQRHSISMMAKTHGVSTTSVRNYFMGVYGVGISAYLKRARLKAATEALDGTNMSVSQVSAMVGYENASKFSAAFKAAIGETPLEYRRRKRCGL
jgi:AraC-like DNA-binding protein